MKWRAASDLRYSMQRSFYDFDLFEQIIFKLLHD